MTDLKERERRVKRILKKLGLDSRQDLDVHFTNVIKYGQAITIIEINPDLSDKEFDETFAHELLHYLGLEHNETTRQINYSSANPEKDILSKTLAKMVSE
jgi:hypothetical protein